MLPQQHRLPASLKLSQTRFYKTTLFSCKYAKNQESVSRFAFLVRKTVDKRAVARNRIRRVFRSCIEQSLGDIVSGYDMLFFLEKGIMEKSHEEVRQILWNFFEHEHLVR